MSDLPKGTVSYIPTNDEETNYQGANDQGSNDQGTHWWWVAGGIAVAAVGIKAFNTSAFNTSDSNVNTPTTGEVTITGTATEDQTLTADTSVLADGDGIGSFTYQWQADNLDIIGATSFDPEGEILSYAWTQTSGNTVSLDDDDTATPRFTAPNNLAADAVLVFQLIVTDASGLASAADTVKITVTASTNAPTQATQASSAAPEEATYSSFAASKLEAAVEATDISFSAIAATDPLSGLAVQAYSLPLTAKEQTLDFSGAHPEINVINIAGSGANTVKIDLDDVLQSGINLFNDANGWAGLDGAGKHQLVVNGDADDTVELAGSWILAGTTTNSDHTYVVYHLDATNADGRSQVLIDQAIHVL